MQKKNPGALIDRKEFYSRIIDLQTSIGGDFA